MAANPTLTAAVPPVRDANALHAYVDERHSTPYAWGRDANDCVGYVLGAVEAQTGVKVAPKAKWADEGQALRTIAKYGSIEAAFDAHFERIPPALAMRGDIAGVPDKTFGIHTMVVEGVSLVGPGERGNTRLPRSAMTIAWSALSAKP